MKSICIICGTEFTDRPSHKRLYCSTKCGGVGRSGPRTQVQKQCVVCAKPYYARAGRASQFCSKACQVVSWRKPKVEITCEYCKKVFDVVPSRVGRVRFCSYACHAMGDFIGKTFGIPNTHRVTRTLPYEKAGYKKITAKVRKRDGYKCQHCQRQFKPREYGLDVHHIVPIRCGGLDKTDNLVSLCRSCHVKEEDRLRKLERATV